MNTPAKAALVGLVATGVVVTSAALVASDPSAPPARADGLVRFADCDALRDWYVDHSLDQVGPYGWGGRAIPLAMEDMGRAASDASSEKAVAGSATGTNTQETDVDEADAAKTDGRLVVRVVQGRHLVVTDVTGTEPRQLADYRLPVSAYVDSLLLVG